MNLGLHLESLLPANTVVEAGIATVLFIYVLGVVYGTRYTYDLMVKKGLTHNVAVYFNRKLIHVLAGGVVALIVPFVFTSPTIPFILALVLALITWIPHKRGKLLTWFQVPDNAYEVNFCIAWGTILLASWLIFNTPIYGLIPVLFMSFGDAATGVVRNLIYRRRTKSWWGNFAMFLACLPIAYYFVGLWGIPVAALSSYIEHYEFNPIDDNLLISATSFLSLLLLSYAGLINI
ncbi:MAG: dolichol kinase [Desulfurococcaceae archaeon]|nr:dolichol kinase [Desulfurococcaceae archaeon]